MAREERRGRFLVVDEPPPPDPNQSEPPPRRDPNASRPPPAPSPSRKRSVPEGPSSSGFHPRPDPNQRKRSEPERPSSSAPPGHLPKPDPNPRRTAGPGSVSAPSGQPPPHSVPVAARPPAPPVLSPQMPVQTLKTQRQQFFPSQSTPSSSFSQRPQFKPQFFSQNTSSPSFSQLFQTPQTLKTQQQQFFPPQNAPSSSLSQGPQIQSQFFPQKPQFQFQQQPTQQQIGFQQPPPVVSMQAVASSSSQQQIRLYKVDGSSADYSTKFENLHPESQKILYQIEERILQYKDESERLDQFNRIYDLSRDSFEFEAGRIFQELKEFCSTIERDKIPVQNLMSRVQNMMRNVDFAIRSYSMLRPMFLHPHVSTSSNFGPSSQYMGATVASSPTQPVSEFYSRPSKGPSPFLQNTVDTFEMHLIECYKRIEEIERLVLMDTGRASSSSSSSLQVLPQVMSNVYDIFIDLASKVEGLHQTIGSMKAAYLFNCRQRGDVSDPFLEADRREIARQEAAARRVHPTLHISATSAQPSTQVAGLFASSAMQQQSAGNAGASFASGFSMFCTPLPSAPARGSSIFPLSNPMAMAPSSAQFGFSGFQLQPMVFGTASPSFASTPTASTQSSIQFSSFGFSPQPMAFGAASTSVIRSAQTPSQFGVPAPSSTQFGSFGFSHQPMAFGTSSTSQFGSTRSPTAFGDTAPSFAFTQTVPAPSSTQFGSFGFSPQPVAIVTASTSQFGSTQTPTALGVTAPSFPSTSANRSSSLFSTPGTATGFGASSSAPPRSSSKLKTLARRRR